MMLNIKMGGEPNQQDHLVHHYKKKQGQEEERAHAYHPLSSY